MTRILAAAMRAQLRQSARRTATTYARPPSQPVAATNKFAPRTTNKRSATTTASPSSPSSSSSSPSSQDAANTKPAPSSVTSSYAESQVNPVAQTPYTPPAGLGNIPGPPAAFANAPGAGGIDWSSSFHGLSTVPFSPETAAVLMRPLDQEDVEIKPDGICYLPEIKYRRILNQAFGPGGWGMAPRGELAVGEKVVTREYALLVHGRFIAQARGECPFFGNDDGIATAGEGCKSNALMRCCKDLGIASELWDPRFLREFKKKYGQEIWVEHVGTKKKRQIWIRRGDDPPYPYKRS